MGKIKQLGIELVKIKYANNPDKLQKTLKELNKIHVVDKNLHEIKQKILGDYSCEFEKVGKISVCDQIRPTHFRFRNIIDYEAYINSIDEGYDPEDSTFNDYLYMISTRHFNLVNRSQYGNSCAFQH